MNQMKNMGVVLSFPIKANGIFVWTLAKKEKETKEKQILPECI